MSELTNPVLETIVNRRSTRSYTAQQVEEEALTAILEAGRYAPSGGNSQNCHFLVIQNPEVLDELAVLVRETFRAMKPYAWRYRSLNNSIEKAQSGRDDYHFFYHAPTLVVVANRKHYPNAMADSACALQDMMITASSLGVGSCWINQLHWLELERKEEVMEFLRELGLGKDETVCGALALGYPAKPLGEPLKRTGNRVTYVR